MKREEALREIETKLNANKRKLRKELEDNGRLRVEYKNIVEYFRILDENKKPDPLLENSCNAALRTIMKWLEDK